MTSTPDDQQPSIDISGLSQEELQTIVNAHFPWAYMYDANVVTYCRADKSPVATGYFKDENLIRLVQAASMTSEEHAAITGIFASARGEVDEQGFTRAIFTQLRLSGWWRYRDRFQLRPPPPDAPVPENYAAPYPVYLDVMVRTSTHPLLSIARLNIQFRQVELLLNLFMKLPLKVPPTQHTVWVAKGDSPDVTSEVRHPGYFAPGLGPTEADVLPPVTGAAAPLVQDGEYYMRRDYYVYNPLNFPRSMSRLFDAFYTLSNADQSRFLNACFWYQEGSRDDGSRSATYQALITAIEAMQPNPKGISEKCPSCGKALINGPTKLFREFLERYAPEGTTAERNDLYRHRSKLSHGDVLVADRMFILGLSPEEGDDRERWDKARKTVQIALINWLLEAADDDALDLTFDDPLGPGTRFSTSMMLPGPPEQPSKES